VTLRRYSPIKPSRGTVIPAKVRAEVIARDKGCVGPRVGMSFTCQGQIELDHIRASHGIGMKSPSTLENLVSLCSWHHRVKTNAGRTWRPLLLEYLVRTA
jgi:5-methylcytosine-specific restriction endonuclease McrA